MLFVFLVLAGCKKDDPVIQKTSQFQINVAGREPITYLNPECQFNDFLENQQQFNSTSSVGYKVFSTYWNSYSMDSTSNQIWIDLLIVPEPPQELYNLDTLVKYLQIESSSYNNEHIKVQVQLDIDGKRFNNQLWDNDPNTPPWETDDALFFKIEEYEIFYDSECLNREVLYIKFQIEGELYDYDFSTKLDSVHINKSEMNLLFAAD
jgi:hypothetical protein